MHRLYTTDITLEKLVDLMVDSRGLTIVADEIAGWSLNMSRYNAGSDRQFYLTAHAGGDAVVHRVKRGEQRVHDAYINIIGGIQPQVARRIFSTNGEDDGLFERFGIVAYPETAGDWQFVDRLPNAAARQAYNAMADQLYAADWMVLLPRDQFGDAKPFVRFDEGAQRAFVEWLREHKVATRNNAHDPLAGYLAKADGLVCRLALTLHLADWASGQAKAVQHVSATSLGRALLLVNDYCIPMRRRVHAAFSAAGEYAGARRIAEYLRAERPSVITAREIRRHEWSGLTTAEEVDAAITTLVEHEWLREKPSERGGRGRPTISYLVNPGIGEVD